MKGTIKCSKRDYLEIEMPFSKNNRAAEKFGHSVKKSSFVARKYAARLVYVNIAIIVTISVVNFVVITLTF
jgi:hypothetical protein